MKKIVPLLILNICSLCVDAQITSPVVRANFGVDGELRTNYSGVNLLDSDDWFLNGGSGTGTFVIDTTGAAAMMARFATDPDFRKLPFFRTMRFPAYTVVNNRLLIDAAFTRDYHGDDSTIFASGSNKNGMSPEDWSTPLSQSVPNKNEILDMMVHVRRAGPNVTDSLWMFGGLSIEGTSGSRYFDFEMYQTDIFYDRSVLKFSGYGPDAGHTSWKFDASGNITQPGDIIFTAEYSSSSLSNIEARIWIDAASLNIVPASFDWAGDFDGASNGAQFGYASIKPKAAGAFYTGLQSSNNTWPGPFGIVLGDNSMPASYNARQFMEFSVNLTKLGLDPVTLLGGDPCGMPFRRIMVKSRASTSFTAELKDFIGPFDFFVAPRAQAVTDLNFYCGVYGMSSLQVTNPLSTSVYTWSTPDGNIVGSNSGPTAIADAPGTYIVTQQLQASCPAYATDTIVIAFDPDCTLLDDHLVLFSGKPLREQIELNWSVIRKEEIASFEIERSTDGIHFSATGEIIDAASSAGNDFQVLDNPGHSGGSFVYYRLRMLSENKKSFTYSKVIRVALNDLMKAGISLYPNPVKDRVQINVKASANSTGQVFVYDASGKLMRTLQATIHKGFSTIELNNLGSLKNGMYLVKLIMGEEVYVEKMSVMH